MSKYLNESGLTYFWGKVDAKIQEKASQDEATTDTKGLMSATDKAKLDGFSTATDYALKTDIVNVYKFKGSVDNVSDLPTEGLTAGDVYDVKERSINYAWTGTEWDALGEVLTINTISDSDIDAIMS